MLLIIAVFVRLCNMVNLTLGLSLLSTWSEWCKYKFFGGQSKECAYHEEFCDPSAMG